VGRDAGRAAEESRLSKPEKSEPAPPPELLPAHQAFERGDFHEVRQIAARVKRDTQDELLREAADRLIARTSLDPVIVALTAGCVLFFVLVVWLSLR
jgi:hypothetical protein